MAACSCLSYGSRLADAYLDAAEFTDCGPDAELALQDGAWSDEAERAALAESAALLQAFDEELSQCAASTEQIGHDLWLTRNGHGAGFWDRPDLYGEDLAQRLTEYSKAAGSVDVYAGDDGELYFS